jgi:hypothetical protein
MDSVIETYRQYYGNKLTHVFTRGSVAKGQAVDNISDIDSFACVADGIEPVNYYESAIKKQYPFCAGVEFQAYTPSELPLDDWLIIQSLCIYGEPPQQPKIKPGNDMVRHANNVFLMAKSAQKKSLVLQKTSDEEKRKDYCVWLMKQILRTGVELTYERSGRFTRDLWLCYKDFSEYYPDAAKVMYQVLYLALNPTVDLDQIDKARLSMVSFLQDEAVHLGIAKAPCHP